MRLPTLGKLIAQPMIDEPAPKLSFKQKIDRWMINEGSRRMYPLYCYVELISRFVVVFILLHVMVYSFGFMNYSMKVHSPLSLINRQDNLTQARALFGVTYPIARAAALTLHVDVALILFRNPLSQKPHR